MLTIEYLEASDLYLVIPVVARKECEETEYMFDYGQDAVAFVKHYFLNPIAAVFAYHANNGIVWEALVNEVSI